MLSPATLRTVGIAAAGAALLCAVGTVAAGIVLAGSYRPHAPGAELALLPSGVRRSAAWVDWYAIGSSSMLVLAAVVLGVVVGLRVSRPTVSSGRAAIVASAVTVIAAVLTVATRPLVQWDQLALWAVTIGSDVDGYWYAAFDDGVRFVLLGGRGVSQGSYAATLVVHLLAPVVAVVGAGLSIRTLMRERHQGGAAGSSASVVSGRSG